MPKKSKTQSLPLTVSRLRESARIRAEREVRRVPWQTFQDAWSRYIDWHEFCFWARSILETEKSVPRELRIHLQERCPGFLDTDTAGDSTAFPKRPLPLRLEDWVDGNVFGTAKRDGWFFAVTYYAIREPRYQRAEVCWAECVKKWNKAKPVRYPSFEDWKDVAERCDYTAHLVSRERKGGSSEKLVDPTRLNQAVSRYIDSVALACWLQLRCEGCREVPRQVARELEVHCDGFSGFFRRHLKSPHGAKMEIGTAFLRWIEENDFREAKQEGWLGAILSRGRDHPRAVRTCHYAALCRRRRVDTEVTLRLSSFDRWRYEADTYVEGGEFAS